jgi:transcriptional regulator with GAF, ATPase, and Fis domain
MEEALQSLALEVGEARSADAVLGRIVRGLAALENVALARVWLIAPGDICESCRMRPECPDQARCLHLAASAGSPIASQEDWSRLTGDFRRIPLNVRKVGEIGASGAPILIAENLAESRWIARPQWARDERIVSFAGQPLIFRGEIMGVLALFSRGAIPLSTFKWLRIFADHAAIAISNARAFDEIGRLRRALEQERDYLREEVREALAFGEIIGGSGALRDVLEQVALVAPTDATVLILGESGTGKELIASALHERSLRRNGPLVRVNCGSIPGELFESEFFGHARGSFTGALRDREGRFQLADGGTLFLDEVGEIPVPLQAKLLRVLQEGQFERVGEEKTRKVSVRVIAATNRDLGQEAENGRFRRDLYYRLNVFPIQLPPLRERKEDIPALAGHFMRLACARLNRPDLHLSDDDLVDLQRYDWPGNVRELENVIERAVILARNAQLRVGPLLPRTEPGLGAPPHPPSASTSAAQPELRHIMRVEEFERLERDNIVAALEFTRWKISGAGGAAELLGINHNTLASRMRALGIKRSRT